MKTNKFCSFCGVEIGAKDNAIVGLNGTTLMCEDCASMLNRIDFPSDTYEIPAKRYIPTPHEIYNHLNEYVIGQDSAKKTLSVAIYNHYKRIFARYDHDNCEIDKSNIVLLGPSGSGKTLLCRTIAKLIDVPFVIADATSLTQSGYVGEDVESVLSKLLQAADYDVSKAEQGIVFIDEIDKLGTKKGSTNITRDVAGEGVQQALLKMLEGSVVGCPPNGGRIHPEQKLIQVDTTNILFICGGAFVGMDEIIRRRHNAHVVGFVKNDDNNKTDDEDILNDVTTQDLRTFGLIPELIGRLPIIAHTTELTSDEMLDVLTKPKNALVKQFKTLFNIDNINIEFRKDALQYIVDKALATKVGARGLRGIMERIMEDYMFDCEQHKGKKIIITKKHIEKLMNN